MTELAIQQPLPELALTQKIDYAKALAVSNLLPLAYRGKPENLLYAMEYADMLDVPPMVAVTGIHVINGQPSASASLIATLVRRAGHKMRTERITDGARCTIVRKDDPDFPHVVEFTVADARAAGLTNSPNWKARPMVMCEWRAISACARLAASEVLFGVAYTPDELEETKAQQDGSYAVTSVPKRVTAAEILRQAAPVDVTDAHVVEDVLPVEDPDDFDPTLDPGWGQK